MKNFWFKIVAWFHKLFWPKKAKEFYVNTKDHQYKPKTRRMLKKHRHHKFFGQHSPRKPVVYTDPKSGQRMVMQRGKNA